MNWPFVSRKQYLKLQYQNDHLKEDLGLITQHDPETPGLKYDSVEQLLDSAVGIAKTYLRFCDHELR